MDDMMTANFQTDVPHCPLRSLRLSTCCGLCVPLNPLSQPGQGVGPRTSPFPLLQEVADQQRITAEKLRSEANPRSNAAQMERAVETETGSATTISAAAHCGESTEQISVDTPATQDSSD